MIIYENRCCDCAVPGYPCIGDACNLRHVEIHVCDNCGREVMREWDLHETDGMELCIDCLKEYIAEEELRPLLMS